jgi:hypothetical protein
MRRASRGVTPARSSTTTPQGAVIVLTTGAQNQTFDGEIPNTNPTVSFCC